MAGIVVKPRARILHGHDWVFSSEVLKVFGQPANGGVISIKDGKDRMLGSAIWNPKSQIVARRFSHRRQDLDFDFFKRRIGQAAEYRSRRGVNPRLHRVVWSESDGLPGVILDRYGEQFVLQLTTLAMDQRKETIADAICETLGAKILVERDDAIVRRAEGLELSTAILRGFALETELELCGVKFQFRLESKTTQDGYLDQVPHYAALAELAPARRVLDCFTNQGAFALVCARAGATEVIGVEIQASGIEGARENSKHNQLAIRWVEQDVFEYLRAAEKAGAEFDLIILDPPSFTKTKSRVHDAIRGYRELHLRALKLLSPEGLLTTFSCSHHMTDAIFANTISDALVDARKSARRLRRFEQALDHPVLPNLPETEYFKGMLIEMMPAR